MSSARYCVPLIHQCSRLFLRSNFWYFWTKYACCEIYASIWETDTRMNKSRPMLTSPISSLCRETEWTFPAPVGKDTQCHLCLHLLTNLMWSRAASSYNPTPYKRTRRIDLRKYSSYHYFGQRSKYLFMYRKCLKNHDAKEENLFYL